MQETVDVLNTRGHLEVQGQFGFCKTGAISIDPFPKRQIEFRTYFITIVLGNVAFFLIKFR